MQKIRQATKKHRTLLLIVVIALCIGMVASFSFWSSENNGELESYSAYADQYKQYIDQIEKPKLERTKYDEAVELYQLYYYLYTYSLYSYYLEGSDEAMLEQSNAALESAAKYANYAAEKYGATLGECDYDDAITVYQHYYDAFTFEYYLTNEDKESEFYEDYCLALKNTCDWLDYAMSQSEASLEDSDYDTAAATYQYYGNLYSSALSYYEISEDESYNELYKSSIVTAYDWLNRTGELYELSEETSAAYNGYYEVYNGLATMANQIAEDVELKEYEDLHIENLKKAYDIYTNSIELTIEESEAAEGGITYSAANTIYSMYATHATTAQSIKEATDEEDYAEKYAADLAEATTWYTKYVDLYIADAEASETGITSSNADTIHSMYLDLGTVALNAWLAGDDSYQDVYDAANLSAIEYYEKSIELAEDLSDTEMASKYAELYQLYIGVLDVDKAEATINEALELDPENVNVVVANANFIYFQNDNNADMAVEYLESCLDYYEEDSTEYTTVNDMILQYTLNLQLVDDVDDIVDSEAEENTEEETAE